MAFSLMYNHYRMSLRKKIIVSFFISALIIGILATFEYINFVQVKNQVGFLEVADSARDRSLKIVRHEKNFFLFPDQAAQEAATTTSILNQMDNLTGSIKAEEPAAAANMSNLVSTYRSEFGNIQLLLAQISRGNDNLMAAFPASASLIPLIQVESRDNPSTVSSYLRSNFSLPASNPQVVALGKLDVLIKQLRDTSENIVAAANSLDTNTRSRANSVVRQSQLEILVIFPLFLLIGLGALLYVSSDIVKKLRTLTGSVEKISKMFGSRQSKPPALRPRVHKDEVDILIDKFDRMNQLRTAWEQKIQEKNQEALLQSKKLVAIGTLASGVAHELNNPLNNISLSAQVLKKKIGDSGPPAVARIVADIIGQTERVRDIVSNLLEFAREKEPQLSEVELTGLIRDAYGLAAKAAPADKIEFQIDTQEQVNFLKADRSQLERVFVNLFTNAIAAIEGRGRITATITPKNGDLEILVSDSGRGMSAADREKVFDPFFTRKDKGTGLGLAIVMNTIQKHGGQISVISEEGIGTIFEIILSRSGKSE